jgi:hypothetical protein
MRLYVRNRLTLAQIVNARDVITLYTNTIDGMTDELTIEIILKSPALDAEDDTRG